MIIIDGRKIADGVLNRLAAQPKPGKFLAAVLVGDDPSSISFLKQKGKTAERLGVDFKVYQFPATMSRDSLCVEVMKLGDDTACGGIIIQLPLPNRDDEQYVLNVIPEEMDVDVLGAAAQNAFRAGTNRIIPPAAGVVSEILSAVRCPLSASAVAVVGVGKLVGQPIATWLTGKTKEVIVVDKGDDMRRIQSADVIVCGTGIPGLITSDGLKENALIIDFGYGLKNGKPMGDFDPLEVVKCNVPGYLERRETLRYTPTPGGTGPILVAKLFENFYELCRQI